MASKSKVYFFFDKTAIRISRRTRLKKTIEGLFERENKTLTAMSYIFCTDERLRAMNWKYLKHDYYTDIITFNLSENENQFLGEAYISVDRIKHNALKLQTPLNEELLRVIFHGALHLCGYNDKSAKQVLQMRKKENYYISLLA